MLENIWNYKMQLVPIFLTYFLFQLPTFLHRMKKEYYVPVYFSIFPFSIINKNLSNYLGDSFCYLEMDDNEAEDLRNKIIINSTISVTISTLIIPFFVGFVGSFFLTPALLWQFLIFFSLERAYTIKKSIVNFHHHIIYNGKHKSLLITVYIIYLGVLLTIMHNTYFWANSFVSKANYLGLISSSWSFLFGTIAIKGIFVAILTIAFTIKFTDRDIRQRNINNNEEQDIDESLL